MTPKSTSLLTFRELRASDADALFSGVFGVETVTRYLQWETHRKTEETQSLLNEMVGYHQHGEKYFWLACAIDDGRPVGLGSLRPDAETVWIGILVFHNEQRKGVGSAMLSALEDAAFRSIARISAEVNAENKASVSLLERAGWTTCRNVENDGNCLVYQKGNS